MTRATLVLVSERLTEEGDWSFIVRCPRRTEMEIRVGAGSPDISVTEDAPQPTDQSPPPPGDPVSAVVGGASKVAEAMALGTVPDRSWSTSDLSHYCVVNGIDQGGGTRNDLFKAIYAWKGHRDAIAGASR